MNEITTNLNLIWCATLFENDACTSTPDTDTADTGYGEISEEL